MRSGINQPTVWTGLSRKTELTAAEERLIALLREGQADWSSAFTVVVRKRTDGRFFVSQSDANPSLTPSFGSGDTFEEAWQTAGRFSRPKASGETLALSLDNELSRALDLWIVGQPEPEPTRGEAAGHAIREWLIGLGMLARRLHPGNTH